MSPPHWLTALGIPEECISNHSSAEENRRRFSIRPQRGNERDQNLLHRNRTSTSRPHLVQSEIALDGFHVDHRLCRIRQCSVLRLALREVDRAQKSLPRRLAQLDEYDMHCSVYGLVQT